MSDVISTVEHQTIVVDSDTQAVIQTTSDQTVIAEGDSGPQGAPGPQGPQGVPGPQGSGGDLTYEQSFTTQTFITVPHNLGKYPSVTVIDSAGDECIGTVDHLSANALTISFSAAFSGSVICN